MRELKDKLRYNHKVKSTTHDVKSSVLKEEGYTEIVDVNMESSGPEIYGLKTVSKGEVYTEITNGEMDTNGSTHHDVKPLSKGEDYVRCANGEMIPFAMTTHDAKSTVSQKNSNQISKIKKSTIGENLISQSMIEGMETARDVMYSGGNANGDPSKKKKRWIRKGKKLAVGVVLNTEIAHSGMRDTEITNGEMDTNESTHLDVKTLSKGEDYIRRANGETIPFATTTQDAKSTVSQKNSNQISKIRKSTTGKILISQSMIEGMETASDVMHSGGNANGDPSKKKKRWIRKGKKLAVGVVLNTEIANSGMRDTEITNGEMDTNGSTHLDVKTLSKGEDYIRHADGETIPFATTTHDAKSTISQKNSHQISKIRKSTTGKTLISQSMIEGMETTSDVMHSGGNANGDPSKKKERWIRKGKKLGVGVVLNTEIANSGMGDTLSIEGPYMQSHVYGGQQMDANIARSLSEKLTIGNDKLFSEFIDYHEVQPMRIEVAKSRKKLLILDVNGLLADVINPPPKDRRSDTNILRRAIFKRPYLDDFLGFCFKRFDVAIWSSRTRKILDPVVDYLLGDLKKKLLFLWDLTYCTNSSVKCLENKYKFIVFKELRKIWEENGLHLYYNESNTLLLDDSPYKALLNPKHTGIFPLSYSYMHANDNSLGPDGDIRVYLEGVATSENVKMYVEQHPFGQHAIDETNPQWAFYSKVLKNVS